MKRVLPLFIMVDACGWEIIREDPFCHQIAPYRRKLRSVFGYSSTCVPSILSGRWPSEHENWCYFVHDPEHSPFRWLKPLSWLPKALTSRRIFRRLLTRLVKRRLGFEGYFDLYNIPFRHISLYDFTEKRSPLKPKGMNQGSNIFDHLAEHDIPYFVSDPEQTEEGNRDDLIDSIEREAIDFAFMYWPGLDGLLHQVGNQSSRVPEKLREYERWIEETLTAAQDHYDEVRLYVFSDHGMANCTSHLDLASRIDALGFQQGQDYNVVYDSTMARFWFFNDGAEMAISKALGAAPEGRIIPDSELKDLKVFFSDRRFGELIFLVSEGTLIVPSHMGERPITAMHGYHPDEPQSYATLMTNEPDLPSSATSIRDIHQLMLRDASMARTLNGLDLEEPELRAA